MLNNAPSPARKGSRPLPEGRGNLKLHLFTAWFDKGSP